MRLLAAFKDRSSGFLELGKIKVQLVEHPKEVLAFEIHLNFPVGEFRTEPRFTEYGFIVSSLNFLVMKFCPRAMGLPRNPQPMAFRGKFWW